MTFFQIAFGAVLFFVVALCLFVSLYRGNDE